MGWPVGALCCGPAGGFWGVALGSEVSAAVLILFLLLLLNMAGTQVLTRRFNAGTFHSASLEPTSIMQDNVQEGAMNAQFSVVFNEPHFAEAIHKEAHP